MKAVGEMLTEIDYCEYVKNDRVHSRIFTDPAIFEDELRRIFYSSWVYLAHESEVSHPGDYCLKWIGRQSVIVSRDEDGQIHALMNRCRHRGNAVCQFEHGNSSFFRCPYHGWTYRNSGELLGASFPDAYGGCLDKSQFGLSPVPRVQAYKGFVFASLAQEGPSLEEHLGKAMPVIDLFASASPSGQVVLSAGCHKTTFQGNWKYVGMDGYHINFTHKSVNDLNARKSMSAREAVGAKNAFSGSSPNRTVDLGHGHVRLDTSVVTGLTYEEFIAPRLATEAGRAYIGALEAAYGKDRVQEILTTSRDPHLGVWPNLQLINAQVRVTRPVAADCTEVYTYPALLGDVPDEINADRLRRHEWFYGPAGFGQPDDSEMFERNQIGLQCEVDPWLLLSRGMEREKVLEDGTIVGHITDEVTQRGQMRQWLRDMTEPLHGGSEDGGIASCWTGLEGERRTGAEVEGD